MKKTKKTFIKRIVLLCFTVSTCIYLLPVGISQHYDLLHYAKSIQLKPCNQHAQSLSFL